MARFAYSAVDPQGGGKAGRIDAPSASAARTQLRALGLVVLSVTPADGGLSIGFGASAGGKISVKTLSLVTRQLATLISSGLRVEEALTIILRTHKPKTARMLDAIRLSLTEGKSLAAALGEHPAVFSTEFVASVRAGEQSGKLPAVLDHLATMIESRAQNRQAMQMALAYPTLLVIVSIAIITMLMIFVIPDIVRVFVSRDADLPLLTEVLIAVSAFIGTWGGWFAIAGGLAIAAVMFAIRQPANRLALHRVLTRIPGFGGVVRKSNAVQFAATLSTLVQSGVPLMDALVAAAAATPNLHIRAQIVDAARAVREGQSLSVALAATGVFPSMLLAMVESGEANGRLGPALAHAAKDQQRDLDAWTKTLLALIEPAVLLLMGGIVMMIVLAIMLPVISMNSLAGG